MPVASFHTRLSLVLAAIACGTPDKPVVTPDTVETQDSEGLDTVDSEDTVDTEVVDTTTTDTDEPLPDSGDTELSPVDTTRVIDSAVGDTTRAVDSAMGDTSHTDLPVHTGDAPLPDTGDVLPDTGDVLSDTGGPPPADTRGTGDSRESIPADTNDSALPETAHTGSMDSVFAGGPSHSADASGVHTGDVSLPDTVDTAIPGHSDTSRVDTSVAEDPLGECAGPAINVNGHTWDTGEPQLIRVSDCIPVPEGDACPNVTDPLPWSPSLGRFCVTSETVCAVSFDGRFDQVRDTGRWHTGSFPDSSTHDRCCYTYLGWEANYDCGRPYRIDGHARQAEVDLQRPYAPAVARWLADARAEHASVAAFAQLALDLLALGAPSSLLAEVACAQADEVRHAEGAFGILSRLVGAPIRPGPLEVSPRPAPTLRSLAVEAAVDGGLNETLAAADAAARLAVATDPAVRAHLGAVVADEARHAALGWKIVDWAVSVGGDEVARAVDAALGEAVHRAWVGTPSEEPVQADVGLCGHVALAEARRRVVAEVIPMGAVSRGQGAGV